MASKAPKLNISPSQLKQLIAVLQLSPNTTIGGLITQLEISQYSEAGSTYIFLHYKSYEKNIDPYWKQFRGVIVKDYTHIVCNSNGHTPNLTVAGSLKNYITRDEKGNKLLNLVETLENYKVVNHTIPLTKGRFYLRPSFQGTVVRVWLSNDIVHRSSLRKFSIANAVWNRSEYEEEAKITFSEKFDQLCRYDRKQLFAPGVRNSPFCHVFMMCTPQATSYSNIDPGKGYVLYLETTECYPPIKGDPTEEYTSHFLNLIKTKDFPLSKADIKAGYLTEEENAAGIRNMLDRYVFPLGTPNPDDYTAKFIPPPTTSDFIERYAAVYRETISMTLSEADTFLQRGMELALPEKELARLGKQYPLFLPGEALYLTCIIKEGNSFRSQNYILSPPCVNYRAAMIGNPKNLRSQLVLLRKQAMEAPNSPPRESPFLGLASDLETASFDNVTQLFFSDKEKTDGFYYGISNDELEPPAPPLEEYSLLHPPAGILEYHRDDLEYLYKGGRTTERNSYTNTRWFILAYHFCLCLPRQRRAIGWQSFTETYQLYRVTLAFISTRYEKIVDGSDEMHTSKAFRVQADAADGPLARMRKLIAVAKTPRFTYERRQEPEIVPDDEPDEDAGFPVPESKAGVIYTAIKEEDEREEVDPRVIAKNIRNLVRKEDPVSLYRMMKLVDNYFIEKYSQNAEATD